MSKAGSGRGRAAILAIGAVLLLVCTACDWTQYMGNAALNGVTEAETTITPANVGQLAESYTVALPVGSQVRITPVVSGGRIFVDASGTLVAASTGTTGCSSSPVVCAPLWTASMPGMTAASPPLVSNNTVYETFSGPTGPGSGVLAAFDANGVTDCSGTPASCQPLWTAATDSIGGANVDQGTLFVADQNHLEAFDAAGVTGCAGSPKVCAPLWSAAVDSQSVPSIAGGKVFVPSLPGSGVLSAFDEAGSTNCSGTPKVCQPLFQVPLRTGSTGSVDVAGGVGYVAAATQNQAGQSQLVAFDANGVTNCSGAPVVCQPLWTAPVYGRTWFATPAVTGGRVYVSASLGSAGEVDVFDAAGSTNCSGTPAVCTPLERLLGANGDSDYDYGSAVVSDGLVIEKNSVFPATDTSSCSPPPAVDCAPLWTAPLAPAQYSGSIVANGTLFVGGPGNVIHAYRVPGT